MTARLTETYIRLRLVVEMMHGGRTCATLAHQLQAVEQALRQAKRRLIGDHLDRRLDQAMLKIPNSHRRLLQELREMSKYV